MFKRFVLAIVFFFMAVVLGFQIIFTVPDQPQIITQTGEEITEDIQCIEFSDSQVVDKNGELNVLVWNIYKQGKDNWQSALDALSADKQLLLLQEASMTESFKQWLVDGHWMSNQVSAFKALGSGAGVINVAQKLPEKACAYTSTEPWLRLPKSALYSQYRLSNGETLAVVNIHAINFTVGTDEYSSQISALEILVKQHTGPILFAGDFNSWNEYRLDAMKQALQQADLQEVTFEPDHRTQFITGQRLDHVFYRGLVLKNAKAPQSDASDHNPLMVSFTLDD
ncbi:endonuclease/exonuclease/phosphatase family protein [Vibrio sp. YIC-376]|uniref:endonuclease/exonuclease/phosphatase family protein n=1 Tax=Vibrio sp. YIC-376 TaxID=3136162 RepID=UPI00402A8EDB